jgi:phosphoribosyl 1,2-cyclic phosphate phosphodiesterase
MRLAIDCGPDFRQQILRAGTRKLDGVLLTHEHNDHIIGLDDVRPFNFMQKSDLPVFASARVAEEVRRRFAYVFAAERYPGAPMILLNIIDPHTPFSIKGVSIIPVEVMHGNLPVLGFRVGPLAYLTDARDIAEAQLDKLRDLEVLVLNALHHQEHRAHLNLRQALELIERLRPRRALLVHISHRMGRHAQVNATLPPSVALGYDGQEIVLRVDDDDDE